MDFTFVKEHPWGTAGIVIGGGVLLFLVLRNRQSSAAQGSTAAGGVAYNTVDPNQLAADVQAQQISAQLSGLQVQTQGQLGIAQLSAGVQNLQTTASQEVTDTQTAAQYGLGVATLNAQVAVAKMQADIQSQTLDLLAAAYGVHNPSGTTSTTVSGSDPNVSQIVTQNPPPATVYTPPKSVAISAPSNDPTAAASNNPGGFCWTTPCSDSAVVPGGTQLVPTPNYLDVGAWPSTAAVDANQTSQINWMNATLNANAANNKRQCIQNAQLSAGRPNFDALMAACG